VRAYRIAYDGQPYHGFQRQPDVPTVEDTLFDALRSLDVLEGDKPQQYAAAGRTDAGVSAVAQTVAFDAPEWLSPAAFNSELPASVRAWASADAPSDFHATHHATEREYTYFLYAPDADESRVRRALDHLAGEHDFHNLTPDGTGTRRTLSTGLVQDGRFLSVRFRSDGFPRQLVRRAVSLVAGVAHGEAGLERIERALSPEPLLGPEGIEPAPPAPLVLTRVSYDLSFAVDEEAARRTREIFHRLRADHASRARVASRILESVR
jgi:tRNA pseudouridine38-40 synthase